MNFFERLINYGKNIIIHSKIWKKYLERKILKYYSNEQNRKNADKEDLKIVKYISKNGLEAFNYDFIHEYENRPVEVMFDKEKGLNYIIEEHGYKLYFRKDMQPKTIKEYYNGICMEQDRRSPHCYLDDELEKKQYGIVLDLGGAEGNFGLSIIDNLEELYIFECDDAWIEAMNYTFEPWKEKVHIIKKFVSDKAEGNFIKLDSIEELSDKKVDLIKMDIEGSEIKAIKGAKKLLENNVQCILLVCLYHNEKDYDTISKMLKGYKQEVRKGKICFFYDLKFKEPFFRYGLMKAYKEK